MPRFYFHIVEDGRVITDEEGQELTERDAVRREAAETGASIARDAFIRGSASRVIVDVRKGDELFLKVCPFPSQSRAENRPGRFFARTVSRPIFGKALGA
jgi:hypothetical protein